MTCHHIRMVSMIASEIDMFNHDLSIQSLLLYDIILYVEISGLDLFSLQP